MIKIISSIIFLLVSAVALSIPLDGGEQDTINVSGYITGQGLILDSVEVTVYEKNEIVERFENDLQGGFTFDVFKDNYYTIEFRRVDYFPKRIIIATDMGRVISSKDFEIEFSVDLIAVKALKGIETDVLDFPVSKFKYSKETRDFEYVLEYVENRFDEIQDLFNEKKKHTKKQNRKS